MLTLGQYLQPTRAHLPVVRYLPPEEFADLRANALSMGFAQVAAGPLVRSSYHAAELYEEPLHARS
jgi:lipoic acid synthetase